MTTPLSGVISTQRFLGRVVGVVSVVDSLSGGLGLTTDAPADTCTEYESSPTEGPLTSVSIFEVASRERGDMDE